LKNCTERKDLRRFGGEDLKISTLNTVCEIIKIMCGKKRNLEVEVHAMKNMSLMKCEKEEAWMLLN